MKAGRPTKYKEEYCELLEEILQRGDFAVTFCKEVGIGEDTFQAWVKKHPSFSKSYGKGKAASKALFVEKMRKAAWGEEDIKANNGLVALLAVNVHGMRTAKEQKDINVTEKPAESIDRINDRLKELENKASLKNK
jgi:hypothetical protein